MVDMPQFLLSKVTETGLLLRLMHLTSHAQMEAVFQLPSVSFPIQSQGVL